VRGFDELTKAGHSDLIERWMTGLAQPYGVI
jgi:hypothetical protein